MAMESSRYHGFVITLHWIMALAFFFMLGSGFLMEDLEQDLKMKVFQWHKAMGILLLVAFFLRIAARFAFKIPALPDTLIDWEKMAAKAGHLGLYLLMLLMPLSGWIMVSSSSRGSPISIFGLFDWPAFPGIKGQEDLHEVAEEAHEFLAIALAALIVIHIAAVIKHAVIDKENLLPRMSWRKG